MNSQSMKIVRWITIAVLAVGLLLAWTRQINGAPVERDSNQTVRMALDLDRHGVMSLDESPPYTPTDYREPVPVLACYLGIKIIDALKGPAAEETYFSGERVQYLKYQNILWLALLSVASFWAALELTLSPALAIVAVILVNLPFAGGPLDMRLTNDLYSEMIASAFFMLACTCLAIGFARRRFGYLIGAGLCFGIVTLTKAAVLYIFVGTVVLLPLFYWLRRLPLRTAIREIAVLVIAFFVVICPWMYRNYVQLGSFQLSQRAGVVLMYRALKDQMTPLEYKGSFYVWAPNSLRKPIGKLLGFTPEDLRRGGRLQRLYTLEDSDFAQDDLAAEHAGRPDLSLTYYRKARAERTQLEMELAKAGHAQAELEGDEILKKRATAMIMAQPGRWLALTIPFLWRGATLVFPILLITLIVAMRRRDYELALLALPAFGLVMFYALFSHFIARYGVPAHEVAMVVLMALVGLPFLPKTKTALSG
jgi:hypothetical protein